MQQSSNIEYAESNPLKKQKEEQTPEMIYGENERLDKLKAIMSGFSLLERKFLVLKGLASVEILGEL